MSRNKKQAKKLMKALKIIKKECESHPQCGECPFSTGIDDCGIFENSPCGWELLEKPSVSLELFVE